jgi:hypothetical protein
MANLRAPNKGMERNVPTSRPSCSLASLSPVPKHVARLVWKLERHYLQPVHAMFRLPIPHYRVWASFSSGLRICYWPRSLAFLQPFTNSQARTVSGSDNFCSTITLSSLSPPTQSHPSTLLEPYGPYSATHSPTIWGSMLRDTRRRPKPSSCEFSQGSG